MTGASGFIGVELVAQLKANGYWVIVATRNPDKFGRNGMEWVRLPSPDEPVEAFEHILGRVNHIVHLAAIHTPQFAVSADTYHSVNCVLTAKLARAAHKTISGKFVFVSTVRAQCGSLHEGIALESDPPQPTDDYGRAKLAAEAEVAAALIRGNYTILRPVLVYGAGMKSNMAMLLRLAALPLPLPLNSLTGKRSLLDRGALCRAIIHCLNEASTDGGTFIVSDRIPVTIPEIVAAMRRGLGRNHSLFSCPPWILNIAARMTGQNDRRRRLNSDLVASSAKLQSTGWDAVENPARRIEELSDTLAASGRPLNRSKLLDIRKVWSASTTKLRQGLASISRHERRP
ncbi:NAD-dependent epimerase/dehydratase family protein [Phyllobacterium sp. LjRoot231]|uniref:NAD-dependent epimerase/dehydratase family protein n=1 Tax=Phyllobacterium sp. LjRoot231 TaxID=3342289 RepID=UPI003ED14E99